MPRHEAKEIVQLDRGLRMTGGKMRPVQKAIWICKLACGHTIERLKSRTQNPPIRAKCELCSVALDAQA